MEEMDIDHVASPIMGLPVELLLQVSDYLPPHSVMLLALTCKKHLQVPSEKIWKQLGPKRLEGKPTFAYLNARRYFLLYLYRDIAKTHRLFTWNSGHAIPRPCCNFWELSELQSERTFYWWYQCEYQCEIKTLDYREIVMKVAEWMLIRKKVGRPPRHKQGPRRTERVVFDIHKHRSTDGGCDMIRDGSRSYMMMYWPGVRGTRRLDVASSQHEANRTPETQVEDGTLEETVPS